MILWNTHFPVEFSFISKEFSDHPELLKKDPKGTKERIKYFLNTSLKKKNTQHTKFWLNKGI